MEDQQQIDSNWQQTSNEVDSRQIQEINDQYYNIGHAYNAYQAQIQAQSIDFKVLEPHSRDQEKKIASSAGGRAVDGYDTAAQEAQQRK